MDISADNFIVASGGLRYALRNFWPRSMMESAPELLKNAELLAVGGQLVEGLAPAALQSVFCRVWGWQGERRYLTLKVLAGDAATIHPVPREMVSGSVNELASQFAKQVDALTAPIGSQAWLEAAVDLLQRYGWCVSAPQYGNDSDVSMYDHARITAALTVCLTTGGDLRGEVALLVGGDLSGVQDWLYSLASSGAAKSLRGRSFYLQLLTEVMAYKILDDLGLPLTNLIYAGGGNFYLLAPVGSQAQLDKLAQGIGAALLTAHEGDLYLAMGSTPIRAEEFAAGAIGAAWGRVTEAMNAQKRQRYANLGAEALTKAVGSALSQGGKPDKVCSICERENPSGKPWPPDKDDPNVRKCGLCISFEELGRDLPSATHIIVTRLSQAASAGGHINGWRDGLRALGYAAAVVDAYVAPADPPAGAVFARIGRTRPEPDVQHDDQAAYAFRGIEHAFSYRPLVNIVPRLEGQIATFDQLCVNSTGIKRWGVLRMDVDNLGKLFQEGLGVRATLTRTTALSFALRLFFEGHLNELGNRYNAASYPPPAGEQLPGVTASRDKIYAMYSGGDDLFIVGAWDALPHLAHDICCAFSRFVAGNPLITLSGGISLATERFPIYQAARQAGEAEEAAKSFARNATDNGTPTNKDALTFLGQAIGWEQFDKVWATTRQLQEWSEARPPRINRSLVQTLRALDSEYVTGLERQRRRRAQGKPGQMGQYYYGPWIWKLVYQLSRVAQQAQHDDEVRDWVVRLRNGLMEPQGAITTLGLVARWTELLTRD
jgi:CRISPR-associated protein Csm1